MQVLVDANAKLGIGMEGGEESNNHTLGQQLLAQGSGLAKAVNRDNFGSLAPALGSLWADEGIRKAYERRREFQVADSISYFFDNLERIAHRE